ncbi:hypothetical protein KL935_000526 [Ogataea polymorpha]|nr:hypothetical protein KL937_000024 [Ogataea polymorpha]KAG7904387.1 hypothetical protein KL935_000526 [Ogataea polymorpha]KAG7940662.1 hypothetical protein KL904_000525 [Ogataea polymorpha]
MADLLRTPLFPVEGLSNETIIKLPPQPSAESGSVKLYLIQAEENLFLEGFTEEETKGRPPTILRGCLFVRVLRPVKIKSISLKLTGTSRTDWPEGIPPKRVEHVEQTTLIQHTWPFFHHTNTYEVTETSRNNADLFVPKSDADCEPSNFSLDNGLSPVTSAIDMFTDMMPVKSPSPLAMVLKGKRPSSPRPGLFAQLSQQDIDLTPAKSNASVDDTKLFVPGDYIYAFEHPIPASAAETIDVTFGSVYYQLEAFLERSGTFKSSLSTKKPVNIVRTPSQDSIEENEPIVINRDWEDQLNYEIVVSSKQVLLNSYLPISFKLSPLDKIKVHRIKVYFTEHLEYYCKNKRVHRTEPPKKFLLLEHKASNEQDNLLSLGEDEISARELEFHVYVPEKLGDRYKLHPDTSFEDIQSHHWIKICIRISRSAPTPEDPKKRKHFELSIDSPIHLLSPLCAHANTLLPSYSEQMEGIPQSRDSIDMLLSSRERINTDSNLYKPDGRTPFVLQSPQAKPFSPIMTPQSSSADLRNSLPLLQSPQLLKNSSFSANGLDFEDPPPNFEETTKDMPPSYDEAIREKQSCEEGESQTTPDTSSSNRSSYYVDERRSRFDRIRDDPDMEGSDLGGNFKLKVVPIRSRSTSQSRDDMRSRSPPLVSQCRSKSRLISSSLIPGNSFINVTNASHGMDDALSQAFSDEDKQPNRPNFASQPSLASVPEHPVSPKREDDPSHETNESNSEPLMNSPGHFSTRSSLNSLTGSLVSEDPATRKPLLSHESTNNLLEENASSIFKLPPENGSSVDITAMLGSSMSNNTAFETVPDARWHPFNMTEASEGSAVPNLPHNIRNSRRAGLQNKTVEWKAQYAQAGAQECRLDYGHVERQLSFGVEPILSVLAASNEDGVTNSKTLSSHTLRKNEEVIED